MGISRDPGRLILGGVLVILLLKSCPASYSYPFLQPSGKIQTVCKTQRQPESRASAVTAEPCLITPCRARTDVGLRLPVSLGALPPRGLGG